MQIIENTLRLRFAASSLLAMLYNLCLAPPTSQAPGAFSVVLNEQIVASTVVQTAYMLAKSVDDVPQVRGKERS
jgi:hypothetical protein